VRRIVLFLLSTVTAVVLLFGYRTSTGGTATAAPLTGSSSSTSTATGSTTTSGSGTTSSGSSGSSGSGTNGSGATSSATTTYDGSATSTRFGDVQVQITVTNGKIIKAAALQVPSSNGRDQEINAYAVPILNKEVVTAQSAQIDTVSGATYTSDGYLTSLQSALDKAGL
jgi:uncharacterized protein with FMN-binding domain